MLAVSICITTVRFLPSLAFFALPNAVKTNKTLAFSNSLAVNVTVSTNQKPL